MEYSTDKDNWSTWSGTEYITAIKSGDQNYYVYIRGTNNTYMTGGSISASLIWVFYKPDFSGQATDMHANGNIETLLDYQTVMNGRHPTMADAAFSDIFDGQKLVEAPSLPATNLASYCYYAMFYNCTSLTTAPSLPATNLASNCYDTMFWGCSSLITAPALPATNLASGCYTFMFNDCSSLNVYSSSGEGHNKEWKIPTRGTATGYTSQRKMFKGCPGDYSGSSSIELNKTFYTQNDPV